MDKKAFRLFYQPIIRAKDGQLMGFEALIRWEHAERGIIMPDKFLPVAEETKLIVPLGEWVVHEACRQVSGWKRFYKDAPLSVSINCSAKQFFHSEFVATVEEKLEEFGLEPNAIKLEVTESALIEDIERTASMLKRLEALGIESHLDDFWHRLFLAGIRVQISI